MKIAPWLCASLLVVVGCSGKAPTTADANSPTPTTPPVASNATTGATSGTTDTPPVAATPTPTPGTPATKVPAKAPAGAAPAPAKPGAAAKPAASPSATSGYLLVFNPPAGKSYTYVTTTRIEGGGAPQPITQSTESTQKVLSVKNGMVTIQTSQKMNAPAGIPAAQAKQFEAQMAKMKSVIVFDKQHQLTKITVNGKDQPLGAGKLGAMVFPKTPLKIGDTFDTDMSSPLGKGKLTLKLTKVDEEGGMKVGVFEATVDFGNPMVAQKGPGIFKIDMGTGMTVSQHMTLLINNPQNKQSGTVTVDEKLK